MICWGFKPLRGTGPETNILVAPETLGLVQMSFLLEAFRPPARCEVLVFGSVNLEFLQQMVCFFVCRYQAYPVRCVPGKSYRRTVRVML